VLVEERNGGNFFGNKKRRWVCRGESQRSSGKCIVMEDGKGRLFATKKRGRGADFGVGIGRELIFSTPKHFGWRKREKATETVGESEQKR